MKRFFAGFVVIMSFSSLGKTLTFYSQEGIDFIEEYRENKEWVFEHFHVKEGMLQDRVISKKFQYLNDREVFKESYIREKRLVDSYILSSHKNFVATEVSDKYLWKTENEWSLDWEEKYANWLELNFDEDFFNRYKIKTDCADVAFSLRWIFARINKLPAANTLAGSGILFSQQSMKKSWESLPTDPVWHKDQRFRKGLEYILNNAYTKTLRKDTYPIKINRESLKVGTINLLGGHTELISKVNIEGNGILPIELLSSTMPAAVRTLMKNYFMMKENTPETEGGLLRFRWPIKRKEHWSLVKQEEMPLFSREQYSEDFQKDSFFLNVFKRMGLGFSRDSLLKGIIKNFSEKIKERIAIVNEGYEYCQGHNCELGTNGYEAWSTPSRDGRLIDSYNEVNELLRALEVDFPGINKKFKALFSKESINILGYEVSMLEVFRSLSLSYLSYDPRDSVEERWALTADYAKKSLNKRIERLEINREKILEEGSFCFKSPANCKPLSSPWKKFQTYERDFEIKNLGFSLVTVCLENNLNCSDEDIIKAKRRMFYISNPLYDLDIRRGSSASSDVVILPEFETMTHGPENIFILDKRKIFNGANNTQTVYERDFVRVLNLKRRQKVIALMSNGEIVEILKNGDLRSLYFIEESTAIVDISQTSDEKVFLSCRKSDLEKNTGILFSFNSEKGLVIDKKTLYMDIPRNNTTTDFVVDYNNDYTDFRVVNLLTGDELKLHELDDYNADIRQLEGGIAVIGKYFYQISKNKLFDLKFPEQWEFGGTILELDDSYFFTINNFDDSSCSIIELDKDTLKITESFPEKIRSRFCQFARVRNNDFFLWGRSFREGSFKDEAFIFKENQVRKVIDFKDNASFGGNSRTHFVINYNTSKQHKLVEIDSFNGVRKSGYLDLSLAGKNFQYALKRRYYTDFLLERNLSYFLGEIEVIDQEGFTKLLASGVLSSLNERMLVDFNSRGVYILKD